jgi:glycosyltransferase involved in cell wall biosynthesis
MKLSILIRNKNEAKNLKRALKSVRYQEFAPQDYEIVVVDDHSEDDSIQVAKDFGCRVVVLTGTFSYGRAINFGIQECRGEIVLLLSAHNFLLGNQFLKDLVRQFDNSKIAAVRCTPVANQKQLLESHFPREINKENFNVERDWSYLIVANCCGIRREVALKCPFNEEIISNEEKLWAYELLKQGYSFLTTVPCYYSYFMKGSKAQGYRNELRDHISKYQVLGLPYISFGKFIFYSVKNTAGYFLNISDLFLRIRFDFKKFLIPFQYHKGKY